MQRNSRVWSTSTMFSQSINYNVFKGQFFAILCLWARFTTDGSLAVGGGIGEKFHARVVTQLGLSMLAGFDVRNHEDPRYLGCPPHLVTDECVRYENILVLVERMPHDATEVSCILLVKQQF